MNDIDNLFNQFRLIFGSTWLNIFGGNTEASRKAYAEMRETWHKALKNFLPGDLAFGLKEALKSGKAFAPSLPEFVAMCRPSPQSLMYKEFKSIPKPPANQELGLSHLKQLKNILGKT